VFATVSNVRRNRLASALQRRLAALSTSERLPRRLALGVLVVGLVGSSLFAAHIHGYLRDRAATAFQNDSDRALALIRLETERVEQLMRASRAFLEAAGPVDAAAFHTYVGGLGSDLRAHYPGVRAIAWTPRVAADELAQLERRLQQDDSRRRLDYPPFRVWPETEAEVRFPAVLVEPKAGNARVYGYDLWTDAGRRAAAQAAIETGRLQASRPVILSQDAEDDRPSQLLLIPVFEGRERPQTAEARRARHAGFVAVGFTVGDLIAELGERGRIEGLGVGVYDLGGVAAAGSSDPVRPLSAVPGEAVTLFVAQPDADDRSYDRLLETRFAGRRWAIGFRAPDSVPGAQGWVLAAGAGAAGAGATVMLALLLLNLSRERLRLRRQVSARARELERANAELQRTVEEARAANHAKSQFLASVSHELRTPLNAIIGFTEILGRELFGSLGSARNRAYVADIQDSGQRLLNQVDRLLDLSRIESGGVDLNDTEVDLGRAIARCCKLFAPPDDAADPAGSAGPDAPATPRVRGAVAETVPPLIADPAAVDQILLNLVGNAVKFSPPDTEVTVAARLTGDGRIELQVSDQGPGIPVAHRSKVVEPFYQVADQHSRGTSGAGLGLAIVNRLVRAHGGELEIAGADTGGTQVTVSFPAERTGRTPAPPHPLARAES
jgi:signal transduction histidine kinase